MEIRYPILLLLFPTVLLIVFYKIKNNKTIYDNASKIANTNYIMNTSYFKEKLKKYNIIKKSIYILFCIIVFSSTLLVSRISKVENINKKEYNRDIYLCMDVSTSVNELNLELVNNLKNTVKSLKKERFGISIFNTSSVTLVPLTDDYEYVISVLDKIYESISTYENMDYNDPNYFSKSDYFMSGTIEGNEQRGSSLIGDGLATCVYSFPNIEEERTRIIIFSTDNDLAGDPIVTLPKAADIAKSKNIQVFGIGTTYMGKTNKKEFENAVLKTGGKFYEQSKESVKSIVSDVEKTSKSLLENETETKRNDIPQVPFILLLISFTLIIILEKKVIK